MIKKFILWLLVFTILIFTGCNKEYNTPADKKNSSDSISKTSDQTSTITLSESIIRAKGESSYGELLILPQGNESINQLGVDSSYGKSTDYSFQCNYNVIYKNKNNEKEVIAKLEDLKIIQPQVSIIKLNRLESKDFDLFYFIPQYTGARSIDAYFFCITKDQTAFGFQFEFNKADANEFNNVLTNTTTLLPQTMKEYVSPELQDNNLITKTSLNINVMDFKIFQVIYKLDLKNKVMLFVKREQLN